MKTQSPDTDPRAEKVLIELIRKAPIWRRLEMVSDLVRTGRTFSMIGLKSRYPSGITGRVAPPHGCSVAGSGNSHAGIWLGPGDRRILNMNDPIQVALLGVDHRLGNSSPKWEMGN